MSAAAESTLPRHRLGHVPALDGLRGIAILAVLGMNAEWSTLGGGFLGVDVFFVLSGFLITTLLVEEWQQAGDISLPRFLQRRALRLMPALVVLLVFATAHALVFKPTEDRIAALQLIAATLGYVVNWVIGVGQVHGTLEHAWSLAVEGQFYLFWGAGLVLALRRGVRLRSLLWTAVALLVASALWRAALWPSTIDLFRLYMGTDTRADSLLAGCILALAFVMQRRAGRTTNPAFLSALVPLAWMIVIAGFIWARPGSRMIYLGGFTVIAFATATIMWHALTNPTSWMARWLAWRPLTWFGAISYSLYLWHVPLKNVLSVERLLPWTGHVALAELARFIAFVGVASASYYGVELPFLRRKRNLTGPSPQVLSTGAAFASRSA